MELDKQKQIELFVKKLGITEKEAEELYEYDKAVDHGKQTQYDLTPEQKKVENKMRRADRKPTTYKFRTRERKPNATKGLIISTLANFLKSTDLFSAEDVEITNKERQIKFSSGGEIFELTLVQKRKSKN